MKPERYKIVRLPRCGVMLQMTRYLAGQSIQRSIAGGVIDPDTYPIRHVFIGDWRLSFPGGDPDVVLSGVNVWPQSVVNCPNGFVWQAQGDAMYYCAVPSKPLEVEAIDLEADDVLVVPTRNLLFVPPGANWRLNGALQTGQQMIATENNTARIQAVAPMRAWRISAK
jgi:hypothetical protein